MGVLFRSRAVTSVSHHFIMLVWVGWVGLEEVLRPTTSFRCHTTALMAGMLVCTGTGVVDRIDKMYDVGDGASIRKSVCTC